MNEIIKEEIVLQTLSTLKDSEGYELSNELVWIDMENNIDPKAYEYGRIDRLTATGEWRVIKRTEILVKGN